MSARINFLKLSRPVIFLTCAFLVACETGKPPEYGLVTWYITTGVGSAMTLSVYDKVCNRNYSRVRVPRNGEVPIQTCANSAGRAEIRYQRTGGYSGAGNAWRNGVVSSNQTLMAR